MRIENNFVRWLDGALNSVSSGDKNNLRLLRPFVYFINLIRLIVKFFVEKKIHVRAAALTYYTAFSLIPIAAFVMGIARGFGFDSLVEDLLVNRYKNHAMMLSLLMDFVNNYLDHVKGGAIVGFGLAMLLWAIFRMFNQTERVFNDIWSIRVKRKWIYKIPNYIAIAFFVPILILLTSAISFYFKYAIQYFEGVVLISPSLQVSLKILPYMVAWIVFTLLYYMIPFTQVKFKYAALSGFIFSVAFMVFKSFYVYFQTSMSSYNTVYGALAAIPFLLIFLQTSWMLVLLGCSFTFTVQCLNGFEKEDEVREVSMRYFEFACLVIVKMSVEKRLSTQSHLKIEDITKVMPYRMAVMCLDRLCSGNILDEVTDHKTREVEGYRPSDDLKDLTLSKFFDKLDGAGTPPDRFNLHRTKYGYLWNYVEDMRKIMLKSDDRLIKYLENDYTIEP